MGNMLKTRLLGATVPANTPQSGPKSAWIAVLFDSVSDQIIASRQKLICSARP